MSACFKRVRTNEGASVVEYFENLARCCEIASADAAASDVIVFHGALFDLAAFRHVVVEDGECEHRAVARIFHGALGSEPHLTLRGTVALTIRRALLERTVDPS